MKTAKAVDINAPAFQKEVADYLAKTPSQPSTIRVLQGEKLVGEIIPAKESRYVAKNNLHGESLNGEFLGDEGDSEFKTMGETLKRL